ncbi:hypothetical protein PENTCL1PPCAC_23299 [Pristionchus entomophagus]|uniref:Uncharacterized protein n=1 Tax=Pristionchus entomophagus TaxID=358040 RepID=A0AAV5U4E8_9BILA|nr:hypothetical protein PENTCL1PPCAC_23299 [Pristionchus entomophagus]
MVLALVLLVLVLAYIGYRVYSSPTQAKADADDPRYQTLRISENVAFEDKTKSGSKSAKSGSKSSKKKN